MARHNNHHQWEWLEINRHSSGSVSWCLTTPPPTAVSVDTTVGVASNQQTQQWEWLDINNHHQWEWLEINRHSSGSVSWRLATPTAVSVATVVGVASNQQTQRWEWLDINNHHQWEWLEINRHSSGSVSWRLATLTAVSVATAVGVARHQQLSVVWMTAYTASCYVVHSPVHNSRAWM